MPHLHIAPAALLATLVLVTASARGADVALVPLPAAQFPAKAPALLNQEVEVAGTYRHPGFLGPDSVGEMVDPATGKVLVQLIAPPTAQDALGFFVARGNCGQKPCPGIYARGKIVMLKGRPVLSVADVSFESVVQAKADQNALLKALADKDRAGMNKPLLPPGGVPKEPGWTAWFARQAAGAPGKDTSVWGQMQAQSNRMLQRDSNMNQQMFQGPERPADFATPYRGVGDTGLAGFFANFPYQGSGDEFPRVAIVVEEKPRLGPLPDNLFTGASATKDGCWRLRAKVWVDAAHSVDIAPFNWCFSETRFNVPYFQVPLWGQRPSAIVTLSAKFTPKQRTLGPLPPFTPLPETPEYRQTFSYVPLMVGNVLMDMGFFSWDRSDGRVWFLDAPPPAP